MLLAYGVLHGVKPLQCDNEITEHMDRRGLSNTGGAAFVVQTGYTRGIVTWILRPSYGQGSWLDGHRLRNSGAHVTRIRKPCNVFRATMLNYAWTGYDQRCHLLERPEMVKNTPWSSTLQHRSIVNALLGQTSMQRLSIALVPIQLVLV